MTPGDPFDRVVPRGPVSHPPCPQRCWEAVGDGWVRILGVGDRCEHDDLTKQWTCCVQNEGETC